MGAFVETANGQLTLECDKSALPEFTIARVHYIMPCVASGGEGPYQYTITGALPRGLTTATSADHFSIQGAPTSVGRFPFRVNATDRLGERVSKLFETEVSPSPGGITLTSISPNPIAILGGGSVALTVKGTGFTPDSYIVFGTVPVPTTFNNSTTLATTVASPFIGGTPLHVHDSLSGANSNILYTALAFPVPTLGSISPISVPAGSAGVTLTLSLSPQVQGTTVMFGDHSLQGTAINASQVSVNIPADYLAAAQNVNVSIGGSNSLPFVIGTAGAGTLAVGCTPSHGPTTSGFYFTQECSASGGSGAYHWTVSNLPPGLSQVATSTGRVTIYGNATNPLAYSYTVQATDDASHAGNATFTGVVSAPEAYRISFVVPAAAAFGSTQPVTLSLTGNGFTNGSTVYFNGFPLATTVVTTNQLNAILPPTFLSVAGLFQVAVITNGVATNSVIFSVGQGGVTLNSVSPASLPVGSPNSTLTLYGSGFAADSVVYFGPLPVAATFVSSNQLSVTIPQALLSTAQTVKLSVGKEDGNSSANSLLFTVGAVTVACNPSARAILLGSTYSLICNVSGGTAPYNWSTGTLPPGLTSAVSAGGNSITVSGTPLTTGLQTLSLSAAASSGGAGSSNVKLAVTIKTKVTKAGVFRDHTSVLKDLDGNGVYDAFPDSSFSSPDPLIPNFTGAGGYVAGDVPVAGDWSGDGLAKVGIYRPTTGQWFLDYNGNGAFDANDKTYAFGGLAGDIPVVGDWKGLGKTCIGLYRSGGGVWLLDLNCNGVFENTPTDAFFPFGGLPGDLPVVGKWTGTATRVGVVRKFAPAGVPQGEPFFWVLDAGVADAGNLPANHPVANAFAFGGLAGDVFVTGDWYWSGVSMAGIYRNGLWVFDAGRPGEPQAGHVPGLSFGYGGRAGDVPLPAIWAGVPVD